jgi:Domain of unknown function (DUF222)
MLGRWEASEAWAAAGKLAVIRALIRQRALPGYEPEQPGGLPSAWEPGVTQEVSNLLGISLRSADALIDLAWALEARLPLTGAALGRGEISLVKARIIHDATRALEDEQAGQAEKLIAGRLAGKTPAQVAAMIGRAVVRVDPDGARRRREQAQRDHARVECWREHAGTAALAGFGLPPDEVLAADQHLQDRALAYRAAGVPGTLDQLRVRAFLDTINGTVPRPPASPVLAAGAPSAEAPAEATSGASAGPAGPAGPGGRAALGQDHADPGSADPGSPDPGSTVPQAATAAPGGTGAPALAANVMLTVPLATMLGLADQPGEAHRLGALDPALARQMIAAAARHPRSTWCITVTDDHGHAIAHGCARPARKPGTHQPHAARDGPCFTKISDRGPPGGHGTWQLTLAGRTYAVTLVPVPVTSCDHRYRTGAYRPGALLRHLVAVRDGQCTQPTCTRPARSCDFDHARPWHQGGPTCACNAGCRCRRDHQVKQSKGWTLTQPRPGYHQWTTPAGRTYTSEPYQYPI